MEPLTGTFEVAPADSGDAPELAAVAAQTFPLACPPSAIPEDIASFIDANLTAAHFAQYLGDPGRAIVTARQDGRIVGYAMLVRDAGADAAELSKIYVLPEYHGGGASTALMGLALDTAGEWGARRVWLGVNQANERAQRFYAKSGFRISGARTFQLGAGVESDYVMIRELD
ncbi:GNAT family N-acetyltransferase [Mycobacterium colombiense]|uniref:GNAT family N-acetyltransferase n=1 Tax=Mycobacterium colombiense TaxID=339268 RepID=UPI0007FF86B4|nr:GNAT family N-acetyltransferase [Mycobacterium colombiense]OBJ79919.1 GNAT family acetyltransferase [Mycobacterium colombiense]